MIVNYCLILFSDDADVIAVRNFVIHSFIVPIIKPITSLNVMAC